MKRIVLSFLICISFLGCKDDETNSDIKIIKGYEISNIPNILPIFNCKDSNMKILDIDFNKSNILKIKFIYMHKGYGSEIVNVEINDKLKIKKVYYNYDSFDTVGGNKEFYSVSDVQLVLNKNPFTNGIIGLKGKIDIHGTVKLVSEVFYEFSKKEKFSFAGYLICDKPDSPDPSSVLLKK